MSDEVANRGRPRDPAREAEILETALELVADIGYDRVSMEAVASACNASKATLYRRWPSKAAMVTAALRCRSPHDLPMADTGDLRQDLLEGVTRMADSMRGDEISLVIGLLNALRTDDELAGHFRTQMMADKQAAAEAWTRRGINRGQLCPDAELSLMHQIGPAMVVFRLLLTGEPVDQEFCTRLVDEVLLPLVERHTPLPERTPSA